MVLNEVRIMIISTYSAYWKFVWVQNNLEINNIALLYQVLQKVCTMYIDLPGLQSWMAYIEQALVYLSSSAMRGDFNFHFSAVFC